MASAASEASATESDADQIRAQRLQQLSQTTGFNLTGLAEFIDGVNRNLSQKHPVGETYEYLYDIACYLSGYANSQDTELKKSIVNVVLKNRFIKFYDPHEMNRTVGGSGMDTYRIIKAKLDEIVTEIIGAHETKKPPKPDDNQLLKILQAFVKQYQEFLPAADSLLQTDTIGASYERFMSLNTGFNSALGQLNDLPDKDGYHHNKTNKVFGVRAPDEDDKNNFSSFFQFVYNSDAQALVSIGERGTDFPNYTDQAVLDKTEGITVTVQQDDTGAWLEITPKDQPAKKIRFVNPAVVDNDTLRLDTNAAKIVNVLAGIEPIVMHCASGVGRRAQLQAVMELSEALHDDICQLIKLLNKSDAADAAASADTTVAGIVASVNDKIDKTTYNLRQHRYSLQSETQRIHLIHNAFICVLANVQDKYGLSPDTVSTIEQLMFDPTEVTKFHYADTLCQPARPADVTSVDYTRARMLLAGDKPDAASAANSTDAPAKTNG